MKKNFFLFTLCFACLLVALTNSCKKDTGANNYLRGKIDGVSFECNSNFWATPGGEGDKIISFRGDAPPYSIRFYLDGQGSNITTGSYNFQAGKQYNAIVYENNDDYSAGGFYNLFSVSYTFFGSGKITILEIDKKHIKGTFEFVTSVNGATGMSKIVTDGEFYIERS